MNEKEVIAQRAAERIEAGMLVGLGTGSTANLFIAALARRVQQEGLQVTTVSSSVISALRAQQAGLALLALEQVSRLDVYVDGADEVAPDLTLLKGRGADLVREKLLAQASAAFWVLADQSKHVSRIGERNPIPIEVLPFAWQMVKARLEKLGGRGELRLNASQDGVAVTAHGSLVLDMVFDAELDSLSLDRQLSATAGVVEHGIFSGLATCVISGL